MPRARVSGEPRARPARRRGDDDAGRLRVPRALPLRAGARGGVPRGARRGAGVAADVAACARSTSATGGRPAPARLGGLPGAAAYARWLMDQDRKLTALKSLQGRIWAEGFARGRAARAGLRRRAARAASAGRAAGRRVAIFSSGSVLAQKLLFGHSDHGDLDAASCPATSTRPRGQARGRELRAGSRDALGAPARGRALRLGRGGGAGRRARRGLRDRALRAGRARTRRRRAPADHDVRRASVARPAARNAASRSCSVSQSRKLSSSGSTSRSSAAST